MLTWNVRFKFDSEVLSTPVPETKPALFMRTVGFPTYFRTSAAVDLIAAEETRSQWKK